MDALASRGAALKQVVALAVGSGGDVAPIAAIAGALAERGIATTLLAPARYEGLCPRGVVFDSIGADDVFDDVFDDPATWTARDGLAASWRYYGAAARSGYATLRARWSADDTALVSSTFAVAARLVEASHGFRNTTVHLSPGVMFSRAQPPRWPAASIPRRWPQWLQSSAACAAERLAVDPVIRRHLAPALEDAGVRVRHRLFSQFVHSPHRVAYLFPPWFAEAAQDWPASGRHAGFACHRPSMATPSPALDHFLRDGTAPLVVITAGTAVGGRPAWVMRATLALRAVGAKVLVIEPGHANPVVIEAGGLMHASWVPMAHVLSRARLIVHHGGIGTAVDAMRSGTPQWVVPTAHDQPDNADRLSTLGVARTLDARAREEDYVEAWNAGWPDGTHRALVEASARVLADGDGATRVADWVANDTPAPRMKRHDAPSPRGVIPRIDALSIADPPMSVGSA